MVAIDSRIVEFHQRREHLRKEEGRGKKVGRRSYKTKKATKVKCTSIYFFLGRGQWSGAVSKQITVEATVYTTTEGQPRCEGHGYILDEYDLAFYLTCRRPPFNCAS